MNNIGYLLGYGMIGFLGLFLLIGIIVDYIKDKNNE